VRTPHFGIAVRRGPAEEILDQARLAHRAGLDAVWIADHVTGFPVDQPVFEPFTALAAMSAVAPGLELGIAATDPFRRHPVVMGQAAMTLQSFAGTRLLLGLGAGEAMNLDPYGIEHPRPLARLRESTEAIQALGSSSMSAPVEHAGESYTLRRAYLQGPADTPPPLVLLAANAPKSRLLAGEVGDGWLPIMLTPELLAGDLKGILDRGAEVGRDMSGFRVAYHCWLGVADSKEAGLSLIARGAKSALLGFPRLATRLGTEFPADFDWHTLEVDSSVASRVAATADSLPDSVVRNIGAYGTPQDCAEAIGRFTEAGVTDFIFRTINPFDELADALPEILSLVR
jgi:phthiodiolone/phenolphthiodiolone dimycocerosates ketoreductase